MIYYVKQSGTYSASIYGTWIAACFLDRRAAWWGERNPDAAEAAWKEKVKECGGIAPLVTGLTVEEIKAAMTAA